MPQALILSPSLEQAVTASPGFSPLWSRVALEIADALEQQGYRLAPKCKDEFTRCDEVQAGVVALAARAVPVLLENPSAWLREIDVYQHRDSGPYRVVVVIELETHHLFGISVPAVCDHAPKLEAEWPTLRDIKHPGRVIQSSRRASHARRLLALPDRPEVRRAKR
jgi:hypothetical protein